MTIVPDMYCPVCFEFECSCPTEDERLEDMRSYWDDMHEDNDERE